MTRWGPCLALLIGALTATTTIAMAEDNAPMTVTVVPRSRAGAFSDRTLVYLDGRIDADTPERLSKALGTVEGKVAIWLNSPGGNLFAGMQLGRVIRKREASTHIINSRTLLPGECYSACSLAFLGGVDRFSDNGARYGVHRASFEGGTTSGQRDLAPELSAAIQSYIREMGVDARLFDLWVKAGPDEMYVLSQQQARALGVVNVGRDLPEWSIASFPGGAMLQGRQTTADGRGMVYFSCDDTQVVFGSVYEAAGPGEAVAARGSNHWLTLNSAEAIPLQALGVSSKDGAVRSTFILSPSLVRRVMSAKQIGHRMKSPESGARGFDYRVDVDDQSAPMVRTFLRKCLRAKSK
jgi:ATP-dependent protease ClpP protease subunit